MSSLIYTSNTSDNPYRSGVLVGNFVEDMYGLDHKRAYKTRTNPQSPNFDSKKNFCFEKNESSKNQNISEHTDKYRWPKENSNTNITNSTDDKSNNEFVGKYMAEKFLKTKHFHITYIIF